MSKRKRWVSEAVSLETNYVSVENSTYIAADLYTGLWVQSTQYATAVVSVLSDAAGTLELQGSFSGTVVDSAQARTTGAATAKTVQFPIYFPYVRVQWTSSDPPGNTSLKIYTLLTRTVDVTTLSGTNLGDENIVAQGQGPDLIVKDLCAGNNITLSSNADCITIDAAAPPATTLSSAGGALSIVNDGVGPTLAVKGLTAGTGIEFTDSATNITIDTTTRYYACLNGGGSNLTFPAINTIVPIPIVDLATLNGFTLNVAKTLLTYTGLNARTFLISGGYTTYFSESGGFFILINGSLFTGQYFDGAAGITPGQSMQIICTLNPGDTVGLGFRQHTGALGTWGFYGIYLAITQT